MARAVANVVVSTDTFASWVARTNQLADAMTLFTVTVEANTTGANVSGNGFINGVFSANTIAAGQVLRGGSVATSANLNITSNTRFTGAVVYSTANLDIQVANSSLNSAILYVSGGLANVTINKCYHQRQKGGGPCARENRRRTGKTPWSCTNSGRDCRVS
jgi:hypothetical protein